jgi:FdhD protein
MNMELSRNKKVGNTAAITEVKKVVYRHDQKKLSVDEVIAEQPLQIRLLWNNGHAINSRIFSITMRTPGSDEALIAGLLLTEGVITSMCDIACIAPEQELSNTDELTITDNLWEVTFSRGFIPQLASLERYQVTYSSCGLCGTTSLKSLELKNPPQLNSQRHWLNSDIIYQSPEIMRASQSIFAKTGSAHAAALLSEEGELLDLYEDIGRHNALDKLLGARLTNSRELCDISPNKIITSHVTSNISNKSIVVISSRISFEIIQKTVMAGIPVLIAVGAPSDLAIAAAKRFDLTLIGFVSPSSFNLYHGEWRLCPL